MDNIEDEDKTDDYEIDEHVVDNRGDEGKSDEYEIDEGTHTTSDDSFTCDQEVGAAENDGDSIEDLEDSIEVEETESENSSNTNGDFSEADKSTDSESSSSGSDYSEWGSGLKEEVGGQRGGDHAIPVFNPLCTDALWHESLQKWPKIPKTTFFQISKVKVVSDTSHPLVLGLTSDLQPKFEFEP